MDYSKNIYTAEQLRQKQVDAMELEKQRPMLELMREMLVAANQNESSISRVSPQIMHTDTGVQVLSSDQVYYSDEQKVILDNRQTLEESGFSISESMSTVNMKFFSTGEISVPTKVITVSWSNA